MADFPTAVTKTIANEGGARYTEIPGDAGGATKFGISKRAYPQLDIRMLSEDQAREIYRRDYWNAVKGDDIVSQAVAENLFDSAVNLGVGRAVRLAQLTVGVAQDGVPGNDTITAINQAPPDRFVADFTLAKIARYVGICNKDRSQSKFLLGWLNRAMGDPSMSVISSLLAGGAGNLVDSVSNAVDKFVTTDKERMEQQIEREKTLMDHEFRIAQLDQQLSLGQIEVNKVEAANPSVFVAGWRPFIGWIAGVAMTYQFLGYPLLTWLWAFLQAKNMVPTSVGAPQPLQVDQLWVIITGMLGIGGMRSYEKVKGVDTKEVGNSK